eukprot:TRINITY_DN16379_c0_g1_i1.p1 TRINITY_DN16379_c0_g1~~TRINITY_DN16379_c0_g1_i1.p1  ORF type:complete len:213 (-),score=41.38 TRINITY_DN16379_c0_g1_i1:771-1409(-)
MKLIVFILLLLVAIAQAKTFGIDISQYTSESALRCLHNKGNKFAIVRAYQSTGHVDRNAVANIKNAHAAGFEYVDAYIFPSIHHGGNATRQAYETLHNLRTNGAKFGMIWLDVEGTQYWTSSKTTNARFISDLAYAFKKMGAHVGMYTSRYQWQDIAGSSTCCHSLPLWYPHYDHLASFSDFRSFGGWTKPAIKQFAGSTMECGVGVDKNFY